MAKRRHRTAAPTRADQLAEAIPLSEAARLLGVSKRTVQRLVERGNLRPFYLPGSGRPRFPLDQINRLRRLTDRQRALPGPTPLDRYNLGRRRGKS